MNDGINRNDSELNERALEQVSGGNDDPFLQAKEVCSGCSVTFASRGQCDGGRTELMYYLRRNGVDSVQDFRQCPFYRP